MVTKNLLLGVTQDFMIAQKQNSALAEHQSFREKVAYDFVKTFDKEVNLEMYMLEDPFGPIERDQFDSIIVTEETRKGGEMVNQRRDEMGKHRFEVIVFNVVSVGNIENKVSSTDIRKQKVKKVGEDRLSYLREEWEYLAQILDLGEELKEKW